MKTFLRWLASLFGIGKKSSPPPPDPVEMWRASAEALYLQELGRPLDDEGWRVFQQQAKAGWTIDDFRRWIRASAEYAEVHTPKTDPPKIKRVLPRLVPYRQFFRCEDGTPFTAIQCSDFMLLARWQHGEDITPVLRERAALGFNMLRVWTLIGNIVAIGDFQDIDYDRVGDFLDLCAQHGLYVEFTAYTSTERPDHWNRLCVACVGKTNVLLELVNEVNVPVNRLAGTYHEPGGLLASQGSYSGEWPPEPHWGYCTAHTNGQFEEQRKVGHNSMEIWNGPTLTNETSRFPEVGMWRTDPARWEQLAFDAAAGAALLAAGSCFHSVQGKVSVLFSDDHKRVAAAWVAGAKSVNLASQEGNYVHRADLETPDLLRVYERRPGDIVRIRR